MAEAPERELGAVRAPDGSVLFRVWAPLAERVSLHLLDPDDRLIELAAEDRGYFAACVPSVAPGARYTYRLDGAAEWPDPASRCQPAGVHGPSQVLDAAFAWRDQEWRGLPLAEYVLYELHVGTFTPEGSFAAIIPLLDELKALGVTAIELMPVAQFPGERNWGYDGVYPWSVHPAYGGAAGLKRLVDACHRRGLAVVLDVVYNHLGPEGNYLGQYGPYFTDRYKTPWGSAVNVDGPDSDPVRHYLIANALRWLDEFHIDALRIDAVHAILDFSARPMLAELAAAVADLRSRQGRQIFLIAESDLNDPRLVTPPASGGYGLDAQWSDDFHHALHSLVTGESDGYYADFAAADPARRFHYLSRAFRDGFVYAGDYSPHRRRRHGAPAGAIRAEQLVVCAQNHDQVGNRMLGERLAALAPFPALKLAAGTLLLAPFVPLLFMGEEYGETAPFQYFVDHSDPDLIAAVRRGRREEFAAFAWQGEAPDPQSIETFQRSRLNRDLARSGRHQALRDWYAELLRLRRSVPALRTLSRDQLAVYSFDEAGVLALLRWEGGSSAGWAANFSADEAAVELPLPAGRWRTLLHSEEARWGGAGADLNTFESSGCLALSLPAQSFVVWERAE
jgi:maltooligosyltrehalose trehalohydrolase